jgi:glycolate oxidase iron-sulfur subunit
LKQASQAASKFVSHQSDSTTSNPGNALNYELLLDCVHCGLCTSACPTYVETGDENESPRGRIYLMRGVTDGKLELNDRVRGHLELCLDCRACETACPSGVQYGKLIEPFRVAMDNIDSAPKAGDWFRRYILFGLFPYSSKLRSALVPARIAQRTGLLALLRATRLTALLPTPLRKMVDMLPPPQRNEGPLPEFLPAIGRRRATVALFTGCIGDAMFRHVNWATARVLQQNGCDVHVPQTQVCCGAIHIHAGSSEPAQKFADENLAAFPIGRYDAIINNIAGCGSMLKDYGHHWHDTRQNDRAEWAAKVRDVNEFLDQLGLVKPVGEIRASATYHDACHLLHAQKIHAAPRRLLGQVPGLEVVDLPESEICCGAAGTYNLTQPEMSARLSQRKMANIKQTKARVAITSNAGCALQIAREARDQGERLAVVHPMEILDWSYRGIKPDFAAM